LPDLKLTRPALEQLYEVHGAALTAYACTFVNDFASAEDVVHKLFLSLLQKEIKMPDTPIAYLYRATKNTALNAQRITKREVAAGDSVDLPIFTHRENNREAALTLQRALYALPTEQRETVIMRIWSGLTLEEVAAATAVPLNTAASRYRYALEKLREHLKPYENSSEGKVAE
jgi:RNA polymerase sigma-70 factor (ECF subfamily)